MLFALPVENSNEGGRWKRGEEEDDDDDDDEQNEPS